LSTANMNIEDGGLFVGPDDGKALPNPIGGRMVIKICDEDTSGAYSTHDNTIPPNSPGPRPHIHRYHEEVFYVLEGELTSSNPPLAGHIRLAGRFLLGSSACYPQLCGGTWYRKTVE
jgi:hypothetical protein